MPCGKTSRRSKSRTTANMSGEISRPAVRANSYSCASASTLPPPSIVGGETFGESAASERTRCEMTA